MSEGSLQPASQVTLRALEGRPLGERNIREMVEATARAIAERQGVEVIGVHSEPDRISVTLNVGRIAAIGFAAELRRLTGTWFSKKYGGTLWGEAPAEEGEEWKRA